MRVFALSDIHIDYAVNKNWIADLSNEDYLDDILILAGDVSDSVAHLNWCFEILARRFRKVLFVPGNHDLWVIRDGSRSTSLDKFQQICELADSYDVSVRAHRFGSLSIVPLFSWYDYSFGQPEAKLLSTWMDYRACIWPEGLSAQLITDHFLRLNEYALDIKNSFVISTSHFLPRLDLMPHNMPLDGKFLYPVMGTNELEKQIRKLKPQIHVYGHSHINRKTNIDDVLYINNSFGYPHETRIAAKRLICIYEGQH